MSPFNIAGTAPTNTPLTVGDVIGQLPPELVRAGALPLEQPLSLPPALLENALRGGQPALPVFELYRVCPALFQTPVSPQDPRMVALPLAKLPSLIAKAREGQGNGAAPASPFAAMPPSAGLPAERGSPFQMAQPAPQPGAAPAAAGSPAFPMSPFAAVAPAFNGSGEAAPQAAAPAPSPFSIQPTAAAPASASPFSFKAEPAPAPAPAPPAPEQPSPFSMPSAAAPAASPFSLPAAGSPFSMPAGASGTPAGQPFVMPGPAAASASPFGAPQAPASPSPAAAALSPFATQQPAAASSTPLMSAFGSPPNGLAAPTGSPAATAFGTAASAPTAFPSSQAPFGSPPAAAMPSQGSITSLFTPKTQENASTPSAFSPAPSAGGSPFAGMTLKDPAPALAQQPAAPQFQPQQAEAPAPAPAFGQPPAQPAPGAMSFGSSFTPQAPASAPAAAMGGGASGTAKLGFAASLHGFSTDDLGFNPAMVPAWINTQVSAHTLKEQLASGTVVLELGTLIDGIVDVGFRNTLSSAKRNLQIKLPQNEVFHALTASASGPAAAAAPGGGAAFGSPQAVQPASAFNAFVIQPGSPAGQVSRVEPASALPSQPEQQPQPQSAPSAFATMRPSGPLAAATAPGSAFGSPPAAEANPFARAAEPQPTPAPAAAPSPFLNFSAPPAPAQPAPAATSSLFASLAAAPPPAPAQPAPATSPFMSAAPAAAPATFTFPSAPTTTSGPASAPLQPLAGAFQPFGNAAPSASPTGALRPPTKPFDPFASSSSPTGALRSPTGALRSPTASPDSGFNSAQLLGQPSLASSLPAFSTPPVLDSKHGENPFAPTTPAKPAFNPPVLDSPPPARESSRPLLRGVFDPPSAAPTPVPAVSLFSDPAPQRFAQPASQPLSQSFTPRGEERSTTGSLAKLSNAKHSFLGLAPLDTQTDQLLLRALLGTEENLTATRVVELLATQPGLSACVCLHGSQVLSHADKSKPDAVEFQRQAPDIARQLRGLAPLIGIEGAETFTLNAGGRLLTFCFPGSTTVGVLHDSEPSNGLRDKITLIARELTRMLG